METAFNSDVLREQLNELAAQWQLAFGASCCERLLPNYLAFNIDAKWGNFAPIREALDLVWSSLEGHAYDRDTVQKLITICENVAPDSEDFTSLYVSFAQDACFSVCGLLDFLLKNDVKEIVQAATYAMSSVDLFVQELENMRPNDPDLELKILSHPLMQRELEKQRVDLERITNTSVLDTVFLSQLRSESGNNGKSNLNLP
ncbi:DUF416 family protein [Undibacterium sp. WLHG33]|uniref:DUF416 family protein n=1 Tax=Undibacterium sp. WLHG33 TaxID=3412482 RepID=UPI003C2CCEFB